MLNKREGAGRHSLSIRPRPGCESVASLLHQAGCWFTLLFLNMVYLKALRVGVRVIFHFLLHILENGWLFFFLIMYYIYHDKNSSFLSEQNKKTQLHKKTLNWVNLTFGEKVDSPAGGCPEQQSHSCSCHVCWLTPGQYKCRRQAGVQSWSLDRKVGLLKTSLQGQVVRNTAGFTTGWRSPGYLGHLLRAARQAVTWPRALALSLACASESLRSVDTLPASRAQPLGQLNQDPWGAGPKCEHFLALQEIPQLNPATPTLVSFSIFFTFYPHLFTPFTSVLKLKSSLLSPKSFLSSHSSDLCKKIFKFKK